MGSSDSARLRRFRRRRAVLREFNLDGSFSDLPVAVCEAIDALLEARDAAKQASGGSDSEMRSRTSNTAARRARELAALLAGDEKTAGALVDRYSDKAFIALLRRAYLGEREGVAELDRLSDDDAEAVVRRTLKGPPWWEIAPELREQSRAAAVEASEPPVDAQHSDGEATEDLGQPTPNPEPETAPPPAPRRRRAPAHPDPRAWHSEKSRNRNGLPDVF